MFDDFLYDLRNNIGPVIVLVLVLAGLGALIYFVARDEKAATAHKAQVCVDLMTMARTSADSITVKMRCDLPEPESHTTVVPMPVIIPAR